MRIFSGLSACLTLASAVFFSPASAQELIEDPPFQAEIAAASQVGERMFAYDQAAWHATDAFLADMQEQEGYDSSWLRGFLVFPRQDGRLDAVFFGEQDGALLHGAQYVVDGSTVVGGGLLEGDERIPLSADGIRMALARQTALEGMAAAEYGLCANSNPNTVVFPPDENGEITAYVLTPMVGSESYPLGGHYRFTIGSDGEVVNSRRFLNSCLVAPLAIAEEGQRAVGFWATHLLDEHPVEIHFFVSRYLPMSMYVSTATNELLWIVQQGQSAGTMQLDGD